MRRFAHRLVAVACAVGAITTTAAMWPTAGGVQREDRNHDGRADLWRFYDTHGQLTQVAKDNNFDGLSDEQEYYERGSLVRRERDRNLDDRVDMVENFDPTSHQETRSIVDLDFNGTADLLTLYQDGQPVFSEHLATTAAPQTEGPAARLNRDPGAPLSPMFDPLSGQASLSAAVSVPSDGNSAALLPSLGLPEPCFDFRTAVVDSRAGPASTPLPPSVVLAIRSARGPPLLPLI